MKLYWKSYGGARALIKSVYLWLAFTLTLILFPLWIYERNEWWELSLTIIPSMIGFTLGGYAIFIEFGDERFRNLISGKDDGESGESPFIKFNSTFIHFIIVQCLALVYAITAKAKILTNIPLEHKLFLAGYIPWISQASHYVTHTLWFLGVWLLMYTLLTIVAVTLGLFDIAQYYDQYISHIKRNKTKD